MRVAFDVGPLKPRPAGVGIYVRSLAGALAERLGPSALAFIGRSHDAAGLPLGIAVVGRSGRWPYPAWALTLAGQAAARSGADVVHYTDGVVPFMRHGRTIVTVHDLTLVSRWRDHRRARLLRLPLVLAAPRQADAVIVPSRATADEVVRLTGTDARRIEIVPLAPRPEMRPATADEIAAALAPRGLSTGRFILAVGTIEPRKNHVRLIGAFERLVREGRIDDDIRLVIAGGIGWRASATLERIAASPVRARIDQLGYVDDGELRALMSAAGVVTYVSMEEGFGLPVLEAFACRALVVTSNVSALPEVAGDAASTVDPEDEPAIAGALAEIIGAPDDARRRIADAAAARAATFTWSETAARTIAVYEGAR